ncbi:MAG TPA: heme o synthase [Marinobacterium sp.]|nr:heme o synthase [Marinobacterium sp.]
MAMLQQSDSITARPTWRDFVGLCKLNVVAVMVLTLVVGLCLAVPGVPPLDTLLIASIGVGLASSSAAAINHVLDRNIDHKMARTAGRPFPQSRMTPQAALTFAAVIGVIGIGMLALWVNLLTAWLTLFALIGYAVIYTAVLKRATPQNIVIGGVAGAAPPLLGWTAVTDSVGGQGLLLMLIIFAWTPPHFWALCIARRDDYARAGIPMLPNTHGLAYTRLQIFLYTLIMIVVTLLPFVTGGSGLIYLIGVTLLNVRFLYWAARLMFVRDVADSMKMFKYSIYYIMALFVVLLVDHYWRV